MLAVWPACPFTSPASRNGVGLGAQAQQCPLLPNSRMGLACAGAAGRGYLEEDSFIRPAPLRPAQRWLKGQEGDTGEIKDVVEGGY